VTDFDPELADALNARVTALRSVAATSADIDGPSAVVDLANARHPGDRRRRWAAPVGLVASAAAVAALIAGAAALVRSSSATDPSAAAAPPAASVTTSALAPSTAARGAARNISTSPGASTPDNPYGLSSGQYLKVGEVEDASRAITWIPADPSDTWHYQRHELDPGFPDTDERAKCGRFPFDDGGKHCQSFGWSSIYRSTPDATLAAMRKAALQQSPYWIFDSASVLSSGLVPPYVARVLEQALVRIPGVRVQHHYPVGDGRFGDLISIQEEKGGRAIAWRDGYVVDPSTGRVLANYLSGGHVSQPVRPLTYQVVDSIDG
jgi:hypothetical protein